MTHPDGKKLEAFGQGRLNPQEMEAVADHVSKCDLCCAALRSVKDDTFIEIAKSAKEHYPTSVSPMNETHPSPRSPSPDDKQSIPEELKDHPRYEVFGLIGSGGMGMVYKARHRLMDRTVAIKVIHRKFTTGSSAAKRFQREVKAGAKLDHPNIVAAFDADQAGNSHFLVMEFVEGKSLDRILEETGPLPVPIACDYILQAATGLQHAHEQGMVHRDIKPHNLMLTPNGKIKILDFGLARMVDPDSSGTSPNAITAPDMLVGTPDYLAPEQSRSGRRVDIRSDLYSLGCTFYQVLTGWPPFAGGNAYEKLAKHNEAKPIPVDKRRPDIPAPVAAIVHKLLAKKPEDRFAVPAELEKAISEFLEKIQAQPHKALPVNVAPTAQPGFSFSNRATIPGSAPRPTSSSGRGRVLILLLLIMAFIASGIASWYFFFRGKTTPSIPPDDSPMATVLYVLPPEGVWYPDFAPVRDILEKNRMQVVVASTQKGLCKLHPKSEGRSVRAEIALDGTVKAEKYDAIVFAGYHVNDFLSENPATKNVRDLLGNMVEVEGKTVGAICFGMKILGGHNVLRGLDMPESKHFQGSQDYKDYGVKKLSQQAVLVQGSIVLGRGPEEAEEFGKILVDVIKKRSKQKNDND